MNPYITTKGADIGEGFLLACSQSDWGLWRTALRDGIRHEENLVESIRPEFCVKVCTNKEGANYI